MVSLVESPLGHYLTPDGRGGRDNFYQFGTLLPPGKRLLCHVALLSQKNENTYKYSLDETPPIDYKL